MSRIFSCVLCVKCNNEASTDSLVTFQKTLETHILRKTLSDGRWQVLAWLWKYFMTSNARSRGLYTSFWQNGWLDRCTVGLSPSCPGDRNVMRDTRHHLLALRFSLIEKGKKCVSNYELGACFPGLCIIWSELHGYCSLIFFLLFFLKWSARCLSTLMAQTEPQTCPPKSTSGHARNVPFGVWFLWV